MLKKVIESLICYCSGDYRIWKERNYRTRTAELMISEGKSPEEIRRRLGIIEVDDRGGNVSDHSYLILSL